MSGLVRQTKGYSASSTRSSSAAPVTAFRLRSLLTRRPSASGPPGVPVSPPLSSQPRVIRSVLSASTSRCQVSLRRPLPLPSTPLPHSHSPRVRLCLVALLAGRGPIQPNHNCSILSEEKCMLIVSTRGTVLFRCMSPIYLLPPTTRSGAQRASTGELRASPSWTRFPAAPGDSHGPGCLRIFVPSLLWTTSFLFVLWLPCQLVWLCCFQQLAGRGLSRPIIIATHCKNENTC